jgi:hypothetical protein
VILLHIANVCSRDYASNVNAGAAKIVNSVGSISGSRIASMLHETLISEAEDISTTSMQYVDPESKDLTSQAHPIIYGFSLPPRYFSRTPSTSIVVKVFCQIVSSVREHQAWDEYISGSTPSDNANAQVRDCSWVSLPLPISTHKRFCDLERSWTGNKARDQTLFSSLGPSTCANLIKVRSRHITCSN